MDEVNAEYLCRPPARLNSPVGRHETHRYVLLLGAVMLIFFSMMLAGWLRQHLTAIWFRQVRGLEPPGPTGFVVSFPEREAGPEEGEDCCICLDEIAEGQKVRMLPCGHQFHSPCIDRWLTTQQHSCPVCKRDLVHANSEAARGVGRPRPIWRRWCWCWCCKPGQGSGGHNAPDGLELQPLQPEQPEAGQELSPPEMEAVEGDDSRHSRL